MFKFIRKLISNRLLISATIMFIQLVLLLLFLTTIGNKYPLIYLALNTISALMVLWLARKEDNPAFKISWIIFISMIPLLGGLFYLMWGNTPLNRSRLIRLKVSNKNNLHEYTINPSKLSEISPSLPKLATYVEQIGNFPMYQGAECQYYKLGEEFLASLLINLKKAQKFIFLEYFIVEEGKMWDSILDILKERAIAGVEIRFMYDDAGCLSTLPRSYYKTLQKFGIKSVRFNPFRPSLNTYLNYRDHRKICVIDGSIGYIGGINLADEYINEIERFGHWKDNAMLITGNSVIALTTMFLELWDYATENEHSDNKNYIKTQDLNLKGYIQPFSDSPLDDYNVSENVYMHIINSAQKFVYITTPYLILDNEMVSCLRLASQSGIDVRIITPHIPDKASVHAVTRSFYKVLIEAGVKIYEYTPGFIHGKTILSDDIVGVLGTINMDFRSFYMHFECGAILYDCDVLVDIKKDFEETLALSEEILISNIRKRLGLKNFFDALLRLFAPMM